MRELAPSWWRTAHGCRAAALAAGVSLAAGALACSSSPRQPGGVDGGASGGAPGSGGSRGASGCLPNDSPPYLCANPSEGACYHDPLQAEWNPQTCTWGCVDGTVQAPAYDCGGSGGAAGRQCDHLAARGVGGSGGAEGAPGGQIVSFGAPTGYPSGGPPYRLALADLDGDGRLDILATTGTTDGTEMLEGVSVLLNQGGGTFTAPRVYEMSAVLTSNIAAGDLNGDGKPDVVVTVGHEKPASFADVLLNNGDGTLAAPIHNDLPSSAGDVALADLDGDGDRDLVALTGGGVTVLSNRGDGTFAPAVTYPAGIEPTALAVGDLDGDAKPDVAVVNYGGETPLSVFLNTGAGKLAPPVGYAAEGFLTSVEMGDLDGDGHRDLLVLDSSSRLAGFMNQGDGTFAPAVSYAGADTINAFAVGDVTGDGLADVVVAHTLTYEGPSLVWFAGDVGVLVNGGRGALRPPVNFAVAPVERSIVLGDLNGDGKVDVVAANRSFECMNTISVLSNTSP